jgi:hypothetical protein
MKDNPIPAAMTVLFVITQARGPLKLGQTCAGFDQIPASSPEMWPSQSDIV